MPCALCYVWAVHPDRLTAERLAAALTPVAGAPVRVEDAAPLRGGARQDDQPFGSWYRHARSARIGDGPDEVRRRVIARELLQRELPLPGS